MKKRDFLRISDIKHHHSRNWYYLCELLTGAFLGDKMGIRTQKAWAERGRRQLTRENAMEYIKAQSPEAFLLKAKKKGICLPEMRKRHRL